MRFRSTLTLLSPVLLAVALTASSCTSRAAPSEEAPPAPTTKAAEPTLATVASEAPGPRTGLAYAADAHDVVFKPRLSAKSFIAIDADTGEILIARRDRQRRPIASLTKIMTALVVIEQGDLERKARVPEEAIGVEPYTEGLKKGRWYPRELLLYSTLMISANDSAVTLAYDAGGGSISGFFSMMNAKARELGMSDTIYASASGLEDETNFSSARDQAIVARAALAEPAFARIVGTNRKLVDWPPPTFEKEWLNHNRMLKTYPGTFGVKTGYTSRAGGCLVVAVRRDDHAVIAVILDSRQIWTDMPRLVDAAFTRIAD